MWLHDGQIDQARLEFLLNPLHDTYISMMYIHTLFLSCFPVHIVQSQSFILPMMSTSLRSDRIDKVRLSLKLNVHVLIPPGIPIPATIRPEPQPSPIIDYRSSMPSECKSSDLLRVLHYCKYSSPWRVRSYRMKYSSCYPEFRASVNRRGRDFQKGGARTPSESNEGKAKTEMVAKCLMTIV